MRILYVEDNIPNVMLVQRIARIGRHDVISYPEGEQALHSFEQDKPDLVLMDIQLQGKLNGLDVVRKLRARGCATPIIALTAYAMTGDRQRCLEAGCDDYIPKPVSIEELVTVFSRYQPESPQQCPSADAKPPLTSAATSADHAVAPSTAEGQTPPEKTSGSSANADQSTDEPSSPSGVSS